jgi:hypothetical protein
MLGGRLGAITRLGNNDKNFNWGILSAAIHKTVRPCLEALIRR